MKWPKRNANLVKLLDGIADMKLGHYKDNTIDAFGDAYEYLMSMYASNAGKSGGGEFFTPQKVSELLTRIADEQEKRKAIDITFASKLKEYDLNYTANSMYEMILNLNRVKSIKPNIVQYEAFYGNVSYEFASA